MNTTSLVSVISGLTGERRSQIDIEKKQLALVHGTISPTLYAVRLSKELISAKKRQIVLQDANEKTVADYTELKRMYSNAKGFTADQMDQAFSIRCSEYIDSHGFDQKNQIVVAKAWHAAKAKIEWLQVRQTYDFLIVYGKISKPKDYLQANEEKQEETSIPVRNAA